MSDAPATNGIAQRLGPVQASLRPDLEVTRHLFRGQPQYVVRDPLTFQTHQFSPSDYQILIAINSSSTLSEIFRALVERHQLRMDQEEGFYQFILTLHRLNYLILPIADGKLLYERFAGRQRLARWKQITGFLFLRIPLVNPDALLDRTADYVRPLFTRTALAVWCLMMLSGLGVLWQRWDAFRDPAHSILANETLLFLWFALIGLKVVHEFGHAYACKIFGGRVPEMGAFLIAFTPCAYMDASSAWGFSRTRDRVVVSLAGMYFESIVAFAALMLWCWTEDPWISSCAHHVVVLSSVVTIGFNVNPLMRYDGYYVLSDVTGIPNLRQRSMEQFTSILKRVLLGIPAPSPARSTGMRLFLLSYGIASAIYKVMLVLAICTMIAWKFYLVGIGLAVFFLAGIIWSTLRQSLGYLWRSPETRPVRMRAIAVSLIALVAVPAAVGLLPVPGRSVIAGVLQTEDDRVVYAQVDGFLQPTDCLAGSWVQQGEGVCELSHIDFQQLLAETQAQCEVARLQYLRGVQQHPHAAAAAQLRWAHAEERRDHAEQEFDRLTVRSPVSGRVVQIVDLQDVGQFVHKGQGVATIGAGEWMVRCLASEEEIADVRPRVGQKVRVRMQLDGVRELAGTIHEVAVQGSRQVFSPTLTQLGGGNIAVSTPAAATEVWQAHQTMFEIRIRLDDEEFAANNANAPASADLLWDAPAMVLFSTAPQTYGAYIVRRCQQFLNRLRISS